MQVLIDLTTASSFIVSIESQFEPQRLRAEIKVSDWPKQLQSKSDQSYRWRLTGWVNNMECTSWQ